MSIDSHNLYELKLLKHIENDRKLTNRMVAQKLGISVRLAHDVLKRMVEKGLLHVKVIHSRRWDYFLTPKGLTEKARLTLEFFEFSMHFYREARKRSAQVCRNLAEAGEKSIGFLGAGELAEITYLGVQEWNLELQAVYTEIPAQRSFMNSPIKPMKDVNDISKFPILVCMYNKMQPMESYYLPPGVKDNGRFHWIF